MRPLLSLLTTSAFAVVFSAMAGQATADHTYRHAVLSDNPLVYYEFEEPLGAIEVIDSSPNGNKSEFVGSRSIQSPGAGYFEEEGTNVVFGGAGRVGNSAELLNRDSPGWQNVDDSQCGPFFQSCIDYEGGGYIVTGVDLNLGDADNNPANGATPGDWSFEISIFDDNVSNGPDRGDGKARTFAAQIISQPMTGGEDVAILAVRKYDIGPFVGGGGPADDAWDRSLGGTPGSAEAKSYASQFGNDSQFVETLTFATTTPFDPALTQAENAGNPLAYEGEWETIVLSYQASTQEMRWYSEGQLIRTATLGSDTGTVPAFSSLDDPWVLATHFWFNEQTYFSGQLDEFSVYDYRIDDPNGDGDMSDSRIPARYAAMIGAPGQPGDFDGDGDVDGGDFLEWQRNLGDAASLSEWEANFGFAPAVAAMATVPEPASLLLVGMLVATLAVCRSDCPKAV